MLRVGFYLVWWVGPLSLMCESCSPLWLLLFQSTGPRLMGFSTGSVVVEHGLSCSAAHGIFRDQGSNLCLLHWWSDADPVSHQGSPILCIWNLIQTVGIITVSLVRARIQSVLDPRVHTESCSLVPQTRISQLGAWPQSNAQAASVSRL